MSISHLHVHLHIQEGVIELVWHPTEAVVFTACLDKIVRAWDGRSGELLREWHGHTKSILTMSLSRFVT